MNIFNKRPLCLILCIGLSGLLLFSFESIVLKIIVLSIAALLGALSLALKTKKSLRVMLGAACIALICSSLISHLYFDGYFKAYKKYAGDIHITGIVEEVTESSSYSRRLLISAEAINGSQVSYRFYAYPSKSDAEGVIEGARISFTARLDGFSDESYVTNIAKGINAYASDVKDLSILEYTSGTLAMQLSRMREYATRYIISLSDKDSGAILSALLLGERDYLPDEIRLDFKRIGISHILALSGMHLAVLSLGIGKVLTLAGVKKKARIVFISLFVLIYMALTGFSVSVVRAGVMLILSSILFLLSRSKDSLTSLSLAVLVICIFKPYAIMDVSLWLSAMATFGIIAFSEATEKLEKPITTTEKAFRYIAMSLLVSIFAISSTIGISSFYFGGISILAPITSIIFSLFAEVIMYLGCVIALIGWLIPLGWLISPICSLMALLANAFSSIKLAYVSTGFDVALICVIIYSIIFYLFLIVRIKRPAVGLNIIVVCYLITTLLPAIYTAAESNTDRIIYSAGDRCDEVLVRSQNEVCLINSAQYSKSLVYSTLDLLDEAKVTYIDKYYLTHYSWSLDDDIETLTYNVKVDKIYIPAPRNDDEEAILKIIQKSVENSSTEIITFSEDEKISVGEYTVSLIYSEPYGSTSVNALTIEGREERYTYISSGMLSTDYDVILYDYIARSDAVIFGAHGKTDKSKYYLSECYDKLDNLILNSSNVFLVQESMLYLTNKGCNIYSHAGEYVHLK